VTTEHTDQPDDVVSQDQQGLDQEQGITVEPQAGPTSQQILDRITAQDNQIRGLQSLVDGGLNAIRRDTEAWMTRQVGDLRGDLDRDKLLAGLDEDQRPIANVLLQEMDKRAPAAPQPTLTATTNGQAQVAPEWIAIQQYVGTMGISANDPRVQYGLITGANGQIDVGKWDSFRDHLIGLRVQDLNPAATASPATPRAQVPATPNPPVEGGGQSSVGPLTSGDDIRDAFISGRFNTVDDSNGLAEYTKRMAAIGESV
jgi:hypothetical protein